MPWARGGDTSATHPTVMRVVGVPGADERSVNEVSGFFFRLATQSAAHLTDYVVDVGTVQMIGGPNTAALLKQCTRVGLLTKVRVDGLVAYKLLDDPEFIHIRLSSEVEWERQQRADTSDLRLTVPVRLRDGDRCRYCGVPVQWRGRTTTRKATYDHLEPGQPATVATLVVACKGCNSELRDQGGEERETLQPPPAEPFYSELTAAWLTKNGRPTAPTVAPRPGSQPDTANSSTPSPNGQRPGSQPDTASSSASGPGRPGQRDATGNVRNNSPPKSFRVTAGMSSPGSGRDGSGVGTGSGVGVARNGKRSRRGGRR